MSASDIARVATVFVALVNVYLWARASRTASAPITRAAMWVWCGAMLYAALASYLMVLTDWDATIQLIGRFITPLGWAALAIIAARRISLYRNDSR